MMRSNVDMKRGSDFIGSRKSFLQSVYVNATYNGVFAVCNSVLGVLIIMASLIAQMNDDKNSFFQNTLECVRRSAQHAILHYAFYYCDVHGKFGIWKTSEPRSHMIFTLKSSWIVYVFYLGNYVTERILRVSTKRGFHFLPIVRLSHEQLGPFDFLMAPEDPTLAQTAIMGILCFYTADFWRYWAHRVGHDNDFLYKAFPFVHGHHHNQVFMNPLTFSMSPFFHLASWATYLPCVVLACLGWTQAASLGWALTVFPTLTQHLGCDPLPWLTRINHRYCWGALPWIPLYHSYHHLHIIKSGNFGNSTCLFDYVFGTVSKETIYHIEHGEPIPLIKKFFANPNLDKTFDRMFLEQGWRKNRLDLN